MSAQDKLGRQFMALADMHDFTSQYGNKMATVRQDWEQQIPYYDEHYHAKEGEEVRRQRDLTEQIRQHGIQTPITLTQYNDARPYVQDGHHRFIAAQELGMTHVPVRWERYVNGRRVRE